MLRRLAASVVVVLGLLPPTAVAAPGAAPPRVEWRLADGPAGAVLAVAWHAGRLAAADGGRVWLAAPGRDLRALASRPTVAALAFTTDGVLLAGSAEGLHVWQGGPSFEQHTPVSGGEAGAILRIATAPGAVAVAGEGPVHVSRDGIRWERVDAPPTRAVALRAEPPGHRLWGVGEGGVWSVALRQQEGRLVAHGAVRAEPLDAGVLSTATDLRLDLPGADVVVLAADRIAVRGAGAWRIVDPGVPPGALLTRVAAAAGQLWLASDRGLLEAATFDGPWHRSAVTAAVHDLAGDGHRLLVAAADGLHVGTLLPHAIGDGDAEEVAARQGWPARRASEPGPREPSIDEVYRAALAYLDLHPATMRRLRQGLALRAALPELELRFERDRAYALGNDHDESFVSGELRRLHDRYDDRDRSASASVSLSWSLGDLAYDSDAVDLSREARAVIQLRDDVLDEVARLYFERRQVLRDLADVADPLGREADRLRLRADELAAGIDAWTGGWFGSRTARLAP